MNHHYLEAKLIPTCQILIFCTDDFDDSIHLRINEIQNIIYTNLKVFTKFAGEKKCLGSWCPFSANNRIVRLNVYAKIFISLCKFINTTPMLFYFLHNIFITSISGKYLLLSLSLSVLEDINSPTTYFFFIRFQVWVSLKKFVYIWYLYIHWIHGRVLTTHFHIILEQGNTNKQRDTFRCNTYNCTE